MHLEHIREMSLFYEKDFQAITLKSSIKLFTFLTKKINALMDTPVGGEPILKVKYPKILGVTFDSLLRFHNFAYRVYSSFVNVQRYLILLPNTFYI